MFVVAAGNVWDGIRLYGAFCDEEDAVDWAMDHLRDAWMVVRLEIPAE